MPCHPVGNGKYRLGKKGNVYSSKADCEKAYAAYRAKKHSKSKSHHSAEDGKFLEERKRRFGL